MFRLKANKTSLYKLVGTYEALPPTSSITKTGSGSTGTCLPSRLVIQSISLDRIAQVAKVLDADAEEMEREANLLEASTTMTRAAAMYLDGLRDIGERGPHETGRALRADGGDRHGTDRGGVHGLIVFRRVAPALFRGSTLAICHVSRCRKALE